MCIRDRCEDGLYTGRHYFAVIDGVTSKGSLVWPGEKTGGRFAKDVLLGALETLPEDCSAQEAVSVSYTHLDVYKRQGKELYLNGFCTLFHGNCPASFYIKDSVEPEKHGYKWYMASI